MLVGAAFSMRTSSGTLRTMCTSAMRAQAPRPPTLIPSAHVLAGTPTPKDPIEVARIYPDHPLMRFFQRVPLEVPRAGTQGKHADERDTLHVPQAVTEADLSKEFSSRSWLAPELRRKSSADLHNLWYVLSIERNRLATSWEEIKRHNAEGAARMLGESLSHRHHRFVLNERRLALIEAQQQARLDGETQPEEDDGELFETRPTA
ncbi:54S ribosomal protein L4 mitochondrial [Malassezia japonica]|uniref:Large ribosomal subunit protein uL29m n=1 Tax=Malassezia japonica TaxID=223818 RepID=A0AAF0F6B5_9BASI|nr:54S ribosomal protein L4 mitochondrial [Malassezia japonica]WFD39203.1 54S ribosomal protein L4 mitochondrial [Malassezia japonica]